MLDPETVVKEGSLSTKSTNWYQQPETEVFFFFQSMLRIDCITSNIKLSCKKNGPERSFEKFLLRIFFSKYCEK